MSDSAPRDSAVFGGLDGFDDHNVDPDAVDRMLFNFSTTNDPQDWQLDALSPDFNPLPSLPSTYIDTNPSLPSTSAPQQSSAIIPSTQLNINQNSQTRRSQQSQQQPSSSLPQTSQSLSLPSNDTQPDTSQNLQDSLPNTITESQRSQPNPSLMIDDITNTTQKSPQTISVAVSSSLPSTTNPRKRPNSSIVSPNPTRSVASSGSSAKQRISTANCNICGKNISTNGANFRRHEQACRRQRNGGTSSARPPSSPSIVNPSSASIQHAREEPFGNPSNTTGINTLNRRDSDLLNVVRRLEVSINTLDVNARLCLRDALVSLSNKAANPQIQPTPEQEAMNRAAEFLVLRMLFLSGQHVMHTPPGTASPYQDPHQPSTNQQVPSTNTTAGTTATRLDDQQQVDEPDDGTIAASTGVRGASVTQNSPRLPRGINNNISTKQEDKTGDGT